MPTTQIHSDVVAYNDVIESHIEIDNKHESAHHKNDTDDEKNREHHHHCDSISLISFFVPAQNQEILKTFSEVKKQVNYYEIPIYSSFLENIFQPPKNS